ncbi:MAG TPA: ribulose-phosphate 3-epimerase [Legionellales bacterium]|nr:ribulose-phosphate 3-epimerase [Legionellales bacterium]
MVKHHLWPSLLAANLLNLQKDIKTLQAHDVNQIHLDIMDNHYVPNLSFGPDFCRQIHQKFSQIIIDVHLMIHPVQSMIETFAKAGAHRISIHADACTHLHHSLHAIKKLGCQAGLAINPGESIEHLQWCHHLLDYILIMTVNPGFGGQKIIPEVYQKIQKIHDLYPHLSIMVDGGVDLLNIKDLKQYGAQDFVVGSALFQANDFPQCISPFLEMTS